MAKTRRQIREYLTQVDAVVEVLDARVPLSSRNPELDELTGTKPRIVLLAKADLADSSVTDLWVRYFASCGQHALAVDCRSGRGLNRFEKCVRETLAERIEYNKSRGMAGRALRLMVVGIPNSGKSSFINRMGGRVRAEVADRPGVTRQNRWFPVGDGIELLDTPGVLWPKFDDPAVGDKLAFIGSVKAQTLDSETIACRLISVLREGYSSLLCERYRLSAEEIADADAYDILILIGRKRGFLIRGGETDTERTANMLLDEYRGGKLGRLSFERPPRRAEGE